MVLDDVWDIEHEKLLNCIDAGTSSKLFVTTRIRGLLKGCDEVSLELLSLTQQDAQKTRCILSGMLPASVGQLRRIDAGRSKEKQRE